MSWLRVRFEGERIKVSFTGKTSIDDFFHAEAAVR